MQAIFPGLKAMLNHHPVFVHFPIVLWLAALLFILLAVWRSSDEMHRAGTYLLYLGTLSGIITLMTGFYAEESVPPGPASDVVEIHQALMVTSLSIAGGLCLFAFFARKRFTPGLRKLLLLGLIILAGVVSVGADRGGQLVFQYGAGVNWPKAHQQQK